MASVAAPIAPAWRPGPERVLAYVARDRPAAGRGRRTGRDLWSARDDRPEVRVARVEHRRPPARSSRRASASACSARTGGSCARSPRRRGGFFLDAAFKPGTHAFAVHGRPPADRTQASSHGTNGRQLFAGAGWFVSLAWSPDGRWLAFSWPEADQWVFLATARRAQDPGGIERLAAARARTPTSPAGAARRRGSARPRRDARVLGGRRHARLVRARRALERAALERRPAHA